MAEEVPHVRFVPPSVVRERLHHAREPGTPGTPGTKNPDDALRLDALDLMARFHPGQPSPQRGVPLVCLGQPSISAPKLLLGFPKLLASFLEDPPHSVLLPLFWLLIGAQGKLKTQELPLLWKILGRRTPQPRSYKVGLRGSVIPSRGINRKDGPRPVAGGVGHRTGPPKGREGDPAKDTLHPNFPESPFHAVG